ncbi:hypothetical protein COI83_29620 [Bacillus cereus]|nr:hypothetical protein COI83_29620 [Bacillus cereus]
MVMGEVSNQVFYHIQTKKPWKNEELWRKGDSFYIGNHKNPFNAIFDLGEMVVTNNKTQQSYFINDVSRGMKTFIDYGTKETFLADFYHFNPEKTIDELHRTLEHFLRLTRELIFEEVRKEKFSELPSRHTCLWVIPDDIEGIKYWLSTLGDATQIVKLNLSGNLHKGSEEFLRLNTGSMTYLREQAKKYWSGEGGKEEFKIEYLFKGNATVLEVFQPEELLSTLKVKS